MKRKLLYGSALVSAVLACGASAQVVNFHCSDNYALYGSGSSGQNYFELFAGQGAYPDPGNNIWNGFAGDYDRGFGSTPFGGYYSGAPGSSYTGAYGWYYPQPAGNPGNPYAQYGNYGNFFVSGGSGTALFTYPGAPYAAHYTGDYYGQFLGYTGNSSSAGQFSPITFSANFSGDTGYIYGYNFTSTPFVNGSPNFLLGEAGIQTLESLTITLGNVPAGSYGLYIYDANFNNDRGASFSLEADNEGFAHNGIDTATNLDDPDGQPDPLGYGEGANFVIFENVVPDSSGNIVITGNSIVNPYSGYSGEVDIAGLQIIANPLPTEVGLNVASNVYSGQGATFSFSPVFADENAATPGYQWQFSSDGGNTWTDVGADSPTLTIAAATSANAGLYHCIITDNVTSAVGTTPPASLSILTSAFPNLLQPGDSLTEVNNDDIGIPGNTVPTPIFMAANNVEDGTLYQYENFGVNGNSTTAGFTGPAGFFVTPKNGSSLVTGMRIFTSSSHPEADPADYTLLGSVDGVNYTPISSGELALPLTRNAAGGAINISNQALQEIDFANTALYSSYELLFNDARDNTLDTNGIQIAEVQLLTDFYITTNLPTATVDEPSCLPMTLAVAAGGVGPFSYQWIQDGSTVQTGPSSSYSFTVLAGTHTYSVTITGGDYSTTSGTLTIVSGPNTVVVDDGWGGATDGGGGFIYYGDGGDDNYGLQLTDGGGGESTCLFEYGAEQYIGGFVATFTYSPSDLGGYMTGGDGMTFCLQDEGTSAFGGDNGGGGLGFSGISPSFAVELNIYTGANGGAGMAFGTNGSTPDTGPNAPYGGTGPINLRSTDPIYVQLYYDGTNLNVWLTDPTLEPGASTFTTNIAVDLPALLGENFAYVGVTGADGGATAYQLVTDFQYSFTTPPIISSIVAGSSPGTVVISWPASVSSLFTLYQTPNLLGPWTPADMSSLTVSGCENQVTLTAGATAQFYTLALYTPTQ